MRNGLAEIADHIGAWRRLQGLTQAQLAERAGIDRKTLVALESSPGGTSLETVLRVARALGVLDSLTRALDPYETEMGRLRADERLPERVRPRRP